jgi:soluble lytic murein transglycosylase
MTTALNRRLSPGEAPRPRSLRVLAPLSDDASPPTLDPIKPHTAPSPAPTSSRWRWWVSIAWAALVISVGCVTHTHGTEHTSASPFADASLSDPDAPLPLPPQPPPFPYFLTGPMAQARAAFDAEKWADAARLFEAALKAPDPDRSQEMQQGARLLLGLAQSRSGALADAAVTLQSLADDGSILSDYALFAAAEAALADDNPVAALKLARRVDTASVMGGPALLMLGRAHIARAAFADAITVLEQARKHAPLSTPEGRQVALLLGQSHEALSQLEPAADAYFSLIKGTPSRPEAKDARKALDALLPKLPASSRDRFKLPPGPPAPPPDLLADAKSLYNRHRSEDAIAAFDKLRKKHTLKKEPSTWCEATYLIGKSYSKLRQHAKAAPFYDEVVEHCKGVDDHHINALYNGAKAHWNAGTSKTAAAHFALIAKDYPQSSLADDSLLYLSRVQSEQGLHEKSQETLLKQIEQYPKGDMLKEAHWMLFGASYQAARYADTLSYIDAHIAHSGEDDLYTRGRMAYFRARCLEHLKQPADAQAAYRKLILDVPLGFYSMLAFGRLSQLDPDDAATLAATLRPSGPLDPLAGPIPLDASSPFGADLAFQRAILLARVGLWSWSDAEWDRVQAPAALKDLLPWARVALLDASQRFTTSHKRAESLLHDPPSAYPDASTTQPQWALAYPRPFLSDVWTQAQTQSLPPHLIYAIMREESSFNPTIESWANARGLMQLMLSTAESQASELKDPKPSADDLFLPPTSIRLGSGYLAKLGGLFNNHLAFIISGYNGGQGNVGKWLDSRGDQPIDLWIEEIPYGQTRDYAKRVLTTLWRYHLLYNPLPSSLALFDPAQTAKAASGR